MDKPIMSGVATITKQCPDCDLWVRKSAMVKCETCERILCPDCCGVHRGLGAMCASCLGSWENW